MLGTNSAWARLKKFIGGQLRNPFCRVPGCVRSVAQRHSLPICANSPQQAASRRNVLYTLASLVALPCGLAARVDVTRDHLKVGPQAENRHATRRLRGEKRQTLQRRLRSLRPSPDEALGPISSRDSSTVADYCSLPSSTRNNLAHCQSAQRHPASVAHRNIHRCVEIPAPSS